MSQLRQLLLLPDTVAKGHFVVRLTEGIEHPEELLRDYAVTPDLAAAYDRALSLVGDALQHSRSSGAYVHGSFGSGKSHFLAVLSLILGGDQTPWGKPELHAALGRHQWVRQKNMLRLHFHVVGASTLEEKLFGGYLDWLARHHPQAAMPPLFKDDALFQNAEVMRQQVGDAVFFERLNADSAAPQVSGWGSFGTQARWQAASFADASRSPAPQVRAELFSALVRSWFPAFAAQEASYVGIDRGLGELARHAHGLGYHGVVLFLDELILWLASRAADSTWLAQEAQKVAKLVEAQDSARPIPIISFVARQRDISELVGDALAGADAANLRDSLKWWDGRFDTLPLPDRNLPAIVATRVVRPKDEASRLRLAQEYAKVQRGARQSWAALLGEDWSGDDFQKVYPFSPALIQALVALSHYLQRERTALKILMDMLVEHLEDFQLGRLVAVGDLYDVLAGGEEPMDGTMRQLFGMARRLYSDELLPLIQAQHGTANPEKCQRWRPDHLLRLGCANCPQTACRADNRLVKTLLLAALVPQVQVFRNLTATRLVALNHGTLDAVIPGREAQDAVARLRDYAAECGKLHIGDQDDPAVAIALQGVDLRPLLDQESAQDNPGARRKRLRELLYQEIGIAEAELDQPYSFEWSGVVRKGSIFFGNIRTLEDAQLEAKPGDEFRVVVDYPFDEPTHHPREDEDVLTRFLQRGKDSMTLAWLPTFLSDRLLRDLGDLVVIDHVLRPSSQSLMAMSPEDQARARSELSNLASQKKQRVLRALRAAYGVLTPTEGDLDDARAVQRNQVALRQGLKMHGQLAADMKSALSAGIAELLQHRWPRHPQYGERVTAARLTRALERFAQVCDADGHRLPVDRAERKDYEIAADLQLIHLTDTFASLKQTELQEAERHLASRGLLATPTARQVAAAFDPSDLKGFTKETKEFLVLAFAAWGARQLRRDGQLLNSPRIGQVPEDAELEKPPLPSASDFGKALDKAGLLLGITAHGRALNPRNLQELTTKLAAQRQTLAVGGADRLEDALVKRADFFAIEPMPARLKTAASASALMALLSEPDPVRLVQSLAGFGAKTSDVALQRALGDSKRVREALANDIWFGLFAQLSDQAEPEAVTLLASLKTALEADQFQTELSARLSELAHQSQRFLARRPRPVVTVPPVVAPVIATPGPAQPPVSQPALGDLVGGPRTSPHGLPQHSVRGRGPELDLALHSLSQAAAGLGSDEEIELSWQIVRRPA